MGMLIGQYPPVSLNTARWEIPTARGYPHFLTTWRAFQSPTIQRSKICGKEIVTDFDIQRYFDVYPIFQKFKNQSPTIQHFSHFNLQPDFGASVKACSVAWGPWSSFDLIHDVHGG